MLFMAMEIARMADIGIPDDSASAELVSSKKRPLEAEDDGGSSSSASASEKQQPRRQRRARKAPHELLTEAEKKANHIASEQKRRQNIRLGFDQLIEVVPSLSQGNRSEALILQKCMIKARRKREISRSFGLINPGKKSCGTHSALDFAKE